MNKLKKIFKFYFHKTNNYWKKEYSINNGFDKSDKMKIIFSNADKTNSGQWKLHNDIIEEKFFNWKN
jgi:hypothetical protein